MGGVKKPTIKSMKKKASAELTSQTSDKEKFKPKSKSSIPDSTHESKSIEFIQNMKYVSAFKLSQKLDLSITQSKQILKKMREEKKIKLIAKNRGFEFFTSSTPKPPKS